MGALPSSQDLTPIVRAVGVAFFIAFAPPRYHELHFTKSTEENTEKDEVSKPQFD